MLPAVLSLSLFLSHKSSSLVVEQALMLQNESGSHVLSPGQKGSTRAGLFAHMLSRDWGLNKPFFRNSEEQGKNKLHNAL